jgi:hypothetical protein
VSATASRDELVLVGSSNGAGPTSRRRDTPVRLEAALAVVAFATLCIFVLSVGAPLTGVEPDDGAYHHSIVGITMGYFVTLSGAQLHALDVRVQRQEGLPAGSGGTLGGEVPNQWIELPGARYISEKDPGYPFLAAPFQALGVIRWTQLFYGALACVGLFIGARRWLGRFGGLAAVGLYASSGVALMFAWRMYMPTFTDASLVAAGFGVLLWAMLATEASARLRTWAGLAGFVALELATFVRYTDIVLLGCAVVAVVVASRSRVARVPLRTLCWWLASVVVFGAAVAIFDGLVYGGPLRTGYQPGEVTFTLGSIVPNLRTMPGHLMRAMPMLVLALVALAWIIARRLAPLRTGGEEAVVRRDLWIGLALAASWCAIWGLYTAYTWTAEDSTMVTLQVVRFYVPAVGPISLLGAWLVTRVPGPAWLAGLTSTAVIAVMFALGMWSFHSTLAWALP